MIALVPNPTGTGHNMRMYAIARELKKQSDEEIVVFLASLQNVFTSMFEEIGVKVVNFNPNDVINYSNKSHLSENLDWNTMIKDYFVDTFYNGNKILKYMNLFNEYRPNIVVSDYNINATLAAINLNIKNVFVTERYNFTLVDVSNEKLSEGGFKISPDEMNQARQTLNQLFGQMCKDVDLILTDKPYVGEMDQDSLMEQYLQNQKAHFVGPMIRPSHPYDNNIRKELGLGNGPIIVATVSGTTMFEENKKLLLDAFIKLFSNLKLKHKDLEMVLLGRSEMDVPDGIHSIPYLPNWIPLLQEASVLLAHPGWITITEVASLKVPAIFCLASYKEYHEAEAYERLQKLGFETNYGGNVQQLTQKVDSLIQNKEEVTTLLKNYEKIAPNSNGALEAATLILNVLSKAKDKNLSHSK
ncbi:glycosyltransferase [Bacillus sp. WLY-B-L8]|uniref:glycosyltransferase n=1 Tax=Bacillus multifaciens TaxID=3068506 RepID=UPI002741896E|nr:glycosyltransferase [Bacillus sp. WLY-B-L8]MDP7977689.1 glycosyltransferase [Bacillus sp. WLY-B-L8]